MQNKKYELLKNLRKGDTLNNGDVIHCVIRSDCLLGKAKLVKVTDRNFMNYSENTANIPKIEGFKALYITPWHPIKSIDGAWVFPGDISVAEEMKCDAVYSFLVRNSHTRTAKSSYNVNLTSSSHNLCGSHGINDKNEHEENPYASSIRINGIDCAALAHGIAGKSVISHPFYGTLNVERELRKCRGWKDGFVHFGAGPSPFLEEYGNNTVQNESTCSVNNQFDANPDTPMQRTDGIFVAPNVLDQKYGTQGMGCVQKDARTGLANGFVLTLEV